MAKKKTKLELTWIGKDKRPRLEPRILLEDPEQSYASDRRVSENDIFDNMLINGDNLLALKALEQDFTGEVRCIYIDPPYNTGAAFEQYDDGREHSVWLSLMRERLAILWRLLAEDGSLWINIDDNECHYLKVVCDELFGRQSYLGSVVWEKDKGRRSDAALSFSHDYILIYVKDAALWKKRRNLVPRTAAQVKRYKNPDNDPRGPWLQGDNATAKSASAGSRWPITLPSGRQVTPPSGRGWAFSRETYEKAVEEDRVYFGRDGNRNPIIKRYLTDVQDGVVPRSWWSADEAGHNQEAKRDHLNKLLKGIPRFATPKPERLIQRILSIATNPGDLVLDSFAGSGTTGATAHKMGRRWLMVELGEHALTHAVPRLRYVIDGQDSYGITDDAKWKGGGGFRFYRIAPSLLEKDKWGNWVINRAYNKEMLAEAMCKIEGFRYAPSPSLFWMHGQSTETDYIYVTTQTLTHEQLQVISAEVGEERTLLICCSAFRAKLDQLPNLTVKKIPAAVLARCEWGKDDYSLNVQTVMGEEPEIEEPEGTEAAPSPNKKREGRKPKMQEMPLFAAALKGGDQ
jgi:adenine-specific DNA-methyltransferase